MNTFNRWLWMTTLRGMLELQCYGVGENSMVEIAQLQDMYFRFPFIEGRYSPFYIKTWVVYPGPYALIAGYANPRLEDWWKTIAGLELSFRNVIKRWQA